MNNKKEILRSYCPFQETNSIILILDMDVTVIDTPGFAEKDFEEEDKLLYGIIDELKNTVKNVSVFIIILNGEQTSMDGKFESMIRLFGKIFGNQFWNNVLLQTDWTFDERAISTRGENNETKWEIDWNTKLRKTFTDIPVSKNVLPYLEPFEGH